MNPMNPSLLEAPPTNPYGSLAAAAPPTNPYEPCESYESL